MNVWCVYVFILCLCCPVFRQRPCDELVTRPRSPTVCKSDHETEKQRPGPKGAAEPVKKMKFYLSTTNLQAGQFSSIGYEEQSLSTYYYCLMVRARLTVNKPSGTFKALTTELCFVLWVLNLPSQLIN
jgi:hypothetical protein